MTKTYDSLSDRSREALDNYMRDLITRPAREIGIDLKRSKVLELGCGRGRFARILNGKIDSYLGIDNNVDQVMTARNLKLDGVDYVVGDALEIPTKMKFDIVLYAFSWHFLKDYDKALNELDRVTKEGGLVVILEPNEWTRDWADQSLNPSSPSYDKKAHDLKLEHLKKAREAIKKQKTFSLVSSSEGLPFAIIDYWALRKTGGQK